MTLLDLAIESKQYQGIFERKQETFTDWEAIMNSIILRRDDAGIWNVIEFNVFLTCIQINFMLSQEEETPELSFHYEFKNKTAIACDEVSFFVCLVCY